MKKTRVFKPVRSRRKPSARAGRLISKVVFTASGMYTPPRRTAAVVVRLSSLGSGGGGSISSAPGVGCFGDRLIFPGRAEGQSPSRPEVRSQPSHSQDDE